MPGSDFIKPHRAALVSVHDVMPETLSRISSIVDFLVASHITPFTLFVVPGKNWLPGHLKILQQFIRMGGELAGHGWTHHAERMGTVFHLIHGTLISRDEAEHLSLCEQEIAERITLCHAWFERKGFPSPSLYTAPAWAMGRISTSTLRSLPFDLYENQWGVYDARQARYFPLPVTGYMADTPCRIFPLKLINAMNLGLRRPVTRLALHPEDLTLPLFKDLSRHLRRFNDFLSYPYLVCQMQTNGSTIHQFKEAR